LPRVCQATPRICTSRIVKDSIMSEIKTVCPKCKTQYTISADKVGKKVKCKCGEAFEVKEEAKKPLPAPPPRSAPKKKEEPVIKVLCANCGEIQTTKKKMVGKEIRCGDCNKDFTVSRTGMQECPSCHEWVKAEAKPGKKMECPECEVVFVVEAYEEDEEAKMPPAPKDDEATELDFSDKRKDDDDDDKPKKAEEGK